MEQINRAEVDRRIARLRDAYDGEVPVRHVEAPNDPDMFRHGLELIDEGFVGGATAWVADDRDRVLMIRVPGHAGWGIPGGGHEPGERLEETARRETFEETGVEVELTGLRRLRRKEFYPRNDPDRRAYMLEAWFEAVPVDPEIELVEQRWEPGEEILAARWRESPPEETVGVPGEWVDRWDWPSDSE